MVLCDFGVVVCCCFFFFWGGVSPVGINKVRYWLFGS